MKNSDTLKQIISKSFRLSINKNDSFWIDTLRYLGSITKKNEYPSFLMSWIKEMLSLIKETGKVNLYLVMPEDGCWGIYIANKQEYMFSYNEGLNIYISYRLYRYLKEKNAVELLAGLLLHEVAEFIMRHKAEKKGVACDQNKNHGEAIRLERVLLGGGRKADTLLGDVLKDIVELEIERKKVTLNKNDVYTEGCLVNGEETIAEIKSIKDPKESFIVQLMPGQRKTLPYSGGSFTVKAEEFHDNLSMDKLNYEDYAKLMKIIDNYFVEEYVINEEGIFCQMLEYIKKLDYSKEQDNILLKIILLIVGRCTGVRVQRHTFLYNIFLQIDEYLSYLALRDIIKQKYWGRGKTVAENDKKIADEACEEKAKYIGFGFYTEKQEKGKLRLEAVEWFSTMEKAPVFNYSKETEIVECPSAIIEKYYRKESGESIILDYDKNINNELSVHEEVLGIIEKLVFLMQEERSYNGRKISTDTRVVELNMIRPHFWRGRNIFNRGDRIKIYTRENEGCGLAEVIEIRDNSVLIFIDDTDTELPVSGYIKKLEEKDASVTVSLEAIKRLKRHNLIYKKLFEEEDQNKVKDNRRPITCFNSSISEDASQSSAISQSVFGRASATIIQGPPGTGKTTVIAEIILQFLKHGKKVLLSSQTNNAVDNALMEIMKWKNIDMGVGRVASKEEKIADEPIKKIWIKNEKELEEFEGRCKTGYVIGATNVGAHTLSVMKGREFDVLVMDEAGKANLVESLMPMLLVKDHGKFIIVGDHKQGMPFAYDDDVIDLFIQRELELHKKISLTEKDRLSLKEGINKSLFEKLVDSGRESILLNVNYRSSPEIVRLISCLFYCDKLIPYRKPLERAKSIIIVDTSKKGTPEEIRESEVNIEGESKGYKNLYEARLVADELRELLKYKYISTGIRSKHITNVSILSPYLFQAEEIRKQVSYGLRGMIPGAAMDDLLNNITTIDSFQGREDEIIIISFTRSNNDPREVGFLRELNRINVALSRAKRKMVLIGDFQTLMNVSKGYNAGYIRNIFRTIYNFK